MKNNLQTVPQERSVLYTYPNEKVILVTRSHWSSILLSLSIIIFTSIILLTALLTAFYVIKFSMILFIASCLLLLVSTSLLVNQKIIEWYFHLYVISDKKILEIFHSPLIFGKVKEILLSQVRCTEVDSEMKGLLDHIFNIGDVTITFDRPTHEKEVVLKSIKHPNALCNHLSTFLVRQKENNPNSDYWVRDDQNSEKIYVEDFQN